MSEIGALKWKYNGVRIIRSDNEAVVVNFDITGVEKPDYVAWIDPIHREE